MDAAAARGYVELRLQPDAAPALTETEVDALVAGASTDGETFTVQGCIRAIYDGITVKHMKAIQDGFAFATDGQSFQRQQTLDQLEKQRAFYRAKLLPTSDVAAAPYGLVAAGLDDA